MGAKYTQAQAQASKKYHDKLEEIKLRVAPGKKAEYQNRAKEQGKSLNQYIIDCMEKEAKNAGN